MYQHREPTTDVVGLTGPRASGTLRAGNDDRKRVTDWLQAQYVAGRLNSAELEERIEQALAARTIGDLDALTTDLPPIQASAAPSSAHQMPRGQKNHRRHGRDKSFGAHATSYLMVMALLVTIWLLTTPGGYFWPIWPMLGWGIGLASHGLATLRQCSVGTDPRELGVAG
jgi:hypothetical protein